VPKFSECAQCECAGVAAFFTWPFLCSNCHSAPNINVLVLPHFLVDYFCAQIFSVPNVNSPVLLHFLAGHFCAQILRGCPMWMHRCCRIFYLAISAFKLSECAPYDCAGVAAFFSCLCLCPNSERAPNVNAAFFTWPFLHSNCQCAPCLWAGVAAGYFCAQILKVRPMWMRQCWRIFYLTISVLKLSQCAQYEWAGVATFFSGLFLCPNFQSVPIVNWLVLPPFLVGYFCG